MHHYLKMITFLGAGCLSASLHAEGLIDFNPNVGLGVTYDNNLFKFETRELAKASGINTLGDQIKRLDLGLVSSLNVSNQRIVLNANFNDNSYQRYSFLDNVSNNISLNWNWVIGDKLFGVIGKTRNQASVGFTDVRVIQRVIGTTEIDTYGINWLMTPDLVAFATKDFLALDYDKSVFINNNRQDDTITFGLRYTTPLGNQISASWREVDSDFKDRTAQNKLLFGDSSIQKTKNLSIRWMLTHLLAFNGSVSAVDLSRPGRLNNNFSGVNNRFGFDYPLSNRVSVGASMYKELTPVDTVAANFVKVEGRQLNATWDLTEKIKIRSTYLRDDYDFLGNSGLLANASDLNRQDQITTKRLELLYSPSTSSNIQFQYADGKRDSNFIAQSYEDQSLSINLRYYFQ